MRLAAVCLAIARVPNVIGSATGTVCRSRAAARGVEVRGATAVVGGASGRALEVLLDDLLVHRIDGRGVDPLKTMPRGVPFERASSC